MDMLQSLMKKKFFSLTRVLLSILISNMRAGSLKVEASDERYDLSKLTFCQPFYSSFKYSDSSCYWIHYVW